MSLEAPVLALYATPDKKWSPLVVTQVAIDRTSRHIMQRIGCTIMCTNARIIDDEIMMGAGLPGHTTENRAVHSTWERGECVFPARYGSG